MKGAGSLIALALVCLALGFVLGGQAAGPAAPDGTRSFLATLTDDLALRPDQASALGKLLAAEERDLQTLAEKQRQALEGSVQARLQQTEDAMLALLDADQRERYRALTSDDR